MSTRRVHRGIDDGMYRKNEQEARETGDDGSRQAATGSPRGTGLVASMAERPVGAKKPGNAGGAKGPQFKDQRTQEQGTA